MSISNLMQHSVESPSLPYRLAPCAKAISVLFLVFSSPMVWADIHDKSQQRVEQQSSLYPSPVEQKPSPYEYSWNEPDPTGLADTRENEKLAQQQLKNPDADIWNERTFDQIEAENKKWLQQDQDRLEHAETLRLAQERVQELRQEQEQEQVRQQARLRIYALEEAGVALIAAAPHITDFVGEYSRQPQRNALQIKNLYGTYLFKPPGPIDNVLPFNTKTMHPKDIGARLSEIVFNLPEAISHLLILKEDYATQQQQLKLTEKNTQKFANIVKDILDGKPSRYSSTKDDDREDALLSGLNNLYTEATDVSKTIYSIVDNILAAEPESTAKAVVEPKTAEKTPISPSKVAQAPVLKLAPPPKPAPILSHNPQAGSYIANQLATQQMFMTDDLQYRQGETLYTDPITGETDVSSLWLNTTGSKSRFSSGHGQLHTKSNRYAVQLGGTLSKWSSGGNDQGLLGLTAGVGKSTNHSRSTSSHHQAQGSVDGYNLGLYSIWYADNYSKTGPYIDLLAQHSWFNNHITAPKVATGANYRSYLFTTALETGYKLQLIETADTRFFIQPKAKVSWQRTSGLLHNESDTQIKVDENNAVTTKLGMRTAWEFDIDTLSSTRTLQISPSFEANWIYSRMNPGVQLSDIYTTPAKLQNKTELASIHVTPQGTRNIADLKVGIEANINKNLLVWTHLGHQFGSHNYSDTQATLGANYRF